MCIRDSHKALRRGLPANFSVIFHRHLKGAFSADLAFVEGRAHPVSYTHLATTIITAIRVTVIFFICPLLLSLVFSRFLEF